MTQALTNLETGTQTTAAASQESAAASDVLARRADDTVAAVRRLEALTDRKGTSAADSFDASSQAPGALAA
jgi:methyl-accepting chemotaxis protein